MKKLLTLVFFVAAISFVEAGAPSRQSSLPPFAATGWAGRVATITSTGGVDWIAPAALPTALPPTGPASGDLSGSYPAPTVVGLNGQAITIAPSGFLKRTSDNSAWEAVSFGIAADTVCQGNDARVTGALQQSGGTMTGPIGFSGADGALSITVPTGEKSALAIRDASGSTGAWWATKRQDTGTVAKSPALSFADNYTVYGHGITFDDTQNAGTNWLSVGPDAYVHVNHLHNRGSFLWDGGTFQSNAANPTFTFANGGGTTTVAFNDNITGKDWFQLKRDSGDTVNFPVPITAASGVKFTGPDSSVMGRGNGIVIPTGQFAAFNVWEADGTQQEYVQNASGNHQKFFNWAEVHFTGSLLRAQIVTASAAFEHVINSCDYDDGANFQYACYPDHDVDFRVGVSYGALAARTAAPVGTATSFDWHAGTSQRLDLTNATGTVTVTLVNPVENSFYHLEVIEGGTARQITFSPAVKWPGSSGPTFGSSTKNRVDCQYDGTDYLCTFNLAFGP